MGRDKGGELAFQACDRVECRQHEGLELGALRGYVEEQRPADWPVPGSVEDT
jgi:hypothetical protein